MRFLITFSCYGTHLPGESGSIDRNHNSYGTRTLEQNVDRSSSARQRMSQAVCLLDEITRPIVLQAIRQVCLHRSWNLLAAHIRITHIHAVVESEGKPEIILHDFKAYATRALNQLTAPRNRWSRHGSTRYLWSDNDVREAMRYVIEEQGAPMSLYIGPSP